MSITGVLTRARPAALLLLGVALCPVRAFGWGNEGHHIVARIAEQRLTPAAKQQVDGLLADADPCATDWSPTHDTTDKMSCAATWADAVRKTTHKNTYNWHFVDITLKRRDYDPVKDCEPDDEAAKGKCGIYGLDHSLKILRQEITDPQIDRAQALMFVIHIVGDLHQPLHTVEEKVGGNFLSVQYFDVPTNLHKVWDTKLLESRMIQLKESEAECADRLNGEIDASFEQGDPVAWLNEAHALAIDDAYAWLKRCRMTQGQKPVPWLRTTYYRHDWPIVDRQLERAGARLAKILNDSLH